MFGLVAAESLGVPLAGETAPIVAGAYAGQTHHLDPWAIFAAASAAAIAGDNVGYRIGDKGGYRLTRRYGPEVRLDERKLKVGPLRRRRPLALPRRGIGAHYGTRAWEVPGRRRRS